MGRNLLSEETSPYLLQHRDNPVHWHAWNAEALAEARRSGRPILLSIGYAACHWCHVMAHESFEDPDTADLMNRLFVNIKVDREERPDIDQIYMTALQALGDAGGWPLTMFLTPEGEPIWGGTYFPPEPRYGRPSFRAVLQEVARIFREEPDRVEQNRVALLERLDARAEHDPAAPGPELLDAAAVTILPLFDRRSGGFAGAPKFPQASVLEFLWRSARRSGDAAAADAVTTTLRNIVQGGIYDHLAGGMARYSVDDRWLVPHFEKMLYDNAQLIERLALAWVAGGDPLFRVRIDETVGWLLRDMRAEGAFAASIDADSPEGEGAFATWTPAEVEAVLGPEDGRFFASVYDITETGNFEGRSIPNRLARPVPLDDADETRLADMRRRLLAARLTRPQPIRDDKILADWNGLAIAALAIAGALCGREDWLAAARDAYRFILAALAPDGRLHHSLRVGRLGPAGFASDYAAMIRAALALAMATADPAYVADAVRLTDIAGRHHWDAEATAYRFTPDDGEALVARPLPLIDEATPNANGQMAVNLIRLWRLTGDDAYRARADALLARHSGLVAANVIGGASFLNAIDERVTGVDIVIVVLPGVSAEPLVAAVRSRWRDSYTLALHSGTTAELPASHPAHGKRASGDTATAYVCRAETCSAPITEPDALAAVLGQP
jgi:uncharacterized protein YyaL (SSP411 family)